MRGGLLWRSDFTAQQPNRPPSILTPLRRVVCANSRHPAFVDLQIPRSTHEIKLKITEPSIIDFQNQLHITTEPVGSTVPSLEVRVSKGVALIRIFTVQNTKHVKGNGRVECIDNITCNVCFVLELLR